MDRKLVPFASLTYLVSAIFTFAGCTPGSTSTNGPSAPSSSVPAAIADAPAGPGCAMWGGRGFKVSYDAFAMTPQNRTHIEYDDAASALTVHHTWSGQPEINRTLTLSSADHEAVAREFLALCPDDKERASECAPGGCVNVVIQPRTGAPQNLHYGKTATAVIGRLRAFVPELRP